MSRTHCRLDDLRNPITIAQANHSAAIDQADSMGGLDESLEAFEQNMIDTIDELGGNFEDQHCAEVEWKRLEAARKEGTLMQPDGSGLTRAAAVASAAAQAEWLRLQRL